MAKKCIYCGAELSDDTAFCGSCGKAVSLLTSTPEIPAATNGDMPAAETYTAQSNAASPYNGIPGQDAGQPYGNYSNPQQGYGYPVQNMNAGYYYQNQNAYDQSMNVYNQSQYMGMGSNVFSPYSRTDEPVTVGKWIVTMILLYIPIVNIIYFIMLLVGGSSTPKSLTNFARASAVIALALFALWVICMLIFGFTLENIFKELSSSVRFFIQRGV